MHYAKWKKPDLIGYLLLWFHYMTHEWKTDQWLPGAQVGEKDWLHQGELEEFVEGDIGTVTYLDCDDGSTTICQSSQNCILKTSELDFM